MPHRLLLLASDSSLPHGLVELLRDRCRQGPVDVRLLVPLAPRPDAWEWNEAATRGETAARLDRALAELRDAGARVEGTVGCDRDPMVCVNWAMRREPFDEVIVVHPCRARRLRLDLATRIQRAFGVPVTRVSADSAAPA